MKINKEELKDWINEARREYGRRLERLREEQEQVDRQLRGLEVTGGLIADVEAQNERLEEKQAETDQLNEEMEKLQAENDNLHRQLQEEKERNQALEMRLSEMSKLSAGVAKKSPQEELMKALRIFINKSKQKRIEKRTAVKEMVLELANANGIVFPEDLAVTLDSLDDEQPDPKVVHVAGNYNDVHDNSHVDITGKPKTDNGRK